MKAILATVNILMPFEEDALDAVSAIFTDNLEARGIILDWGYLCDPHTGMFEFPRVVKAEGYEVCEELQFLPNWTEDDEDDGYDNEAAQAEGWAVFHGSGHDDKGTLRIERVDEAEVFETDPHAWIHVLSRARAKSRLHLGALRQVRDHNPDEWERLRHVAFGMGILNLDEIL